MLYVYASFRIPSTLAARLDDLAHRRGTDRTKLMIELLSLQLEATPDEGPVDIPEDPLLEMIRKQDVDGLTMLEILHSVGLTPFHITIALQMRVAALLTSEGYRKRRVSENGRRPVRWFRHRPHPDTPGTHPPFPR